ncbi:hypothetical protein HAX54_036373 [Datura stramonium]|uniref:Myb-like domain-containing protein n=1 Tax=Datura stramonium TaxID=4076 RepID=A0ABS8VJJ7_DATST|nr:hypothetical protein [Datura stramonium]
MLKLLSMIYVPRKRSFLLKGPGKKRIRRRWKLKHLEKVKIVTSREKERSCEKRPGKSSKDGCRVAVKKKLKNEQETLIMHDASLDTKTIAHKSATLAVEMLSEGSGGNLTDKVDIVAGDIQGGVSAIDEVKRKKRKKDNRKKDDGQLSPPISDPSDEKHENNEEKLLFGKQFTQEEDESVKDAVYRYMRPYRAVYSRAQRLFRSGKLRKWTEEEYEMRIKLENRKRGQWDQEEIQKLFDLVNTDLQLRLSEEKKSKHGMLRDNICWSAISDNLSTRISQHCCTKWYRQLTSPMVAAGEWADTDDYRLVDALFELDASCIEDVDWDNLVAHRHGDLCRKRWKEMVRQISQHENKSFAAQIEVLAMRYRPDLVGAREAWDRKPVVP